jgi:hypothetical protein
MKLTFGAIAERVSADDIITMIINELAKKNDLPGAPKAVETPVVEEVAEDAEVETKKAKRGLFGRK